ncbi:MAG TPA: hypothetical protein VE546_23630 [Streptomyces sp.]|uniref:hypothetical protein n=1 Tax=Streptomyces sp. TaxID=1931 RepID=UPI002D4FD7CC|nr:hypothetical protein [Streptomyces sp.]HZG06527.1 hypothetical protein [Streptomyces sp.]
MSSRRKLAAVAVVTAVIGSGFTISAPAATAASAPAVSPRGTAPSCVSRDVVKQEKKVTIQNNCGKTMHLKLVIKNGPDGECWTYRDGEARLWRWKVGSYGKVVTC